MIDANAIDGQSGWVLYLGGVRPGIGRADSAELLLHKSVTLGRPPRLVLAAEGDRIHLYCRTLKIDSSTIPRALLGRRAAIQKALLGDAGQGALAAVVQAVRSVQPGWCLSFYSPWIPAMLANVPAWYFINFHPGILPRLRGYEPDTWAILLGFKESGGCLHQVVDGYDEGPIGWQSSAVVISDDDTSASLLCNVTRRFIDEMRHWLPLAAGGGMAFVPQPPCGGRPLSAAALDEQRHIDFAVDSHQALMRKARAFLCHAGESAWLGARLGGEICRVTSLVLGRGEESGIPPGSILSPGVAVAPGVWADCRVKVPEGWVDIDYSIHDR
jgi:hypothetical protein